jgi:hypothetical protein
VGWLNVDRSDLTPGVDRLQRDITAACRAAARDAGRTAVKQIAATARTNGWRFAGGRLGARVKSVDASLTGATAWVLPRPAGGWSVLEYGTGAYTITPRRRKVLAAGRDRDQVYGTKVNRKPLRGRRAWTRATDAIDVDRDVSDVFDRALIG